MVNFNEHPHRRYNILTGEWILVSPHRTKRPWQGMNEAPAIFPSENYDPHCYLCPGNIRANKKVNPEYKEPYSFTNDFAALLPGVVHSSYEEGLLKAKTESGTCKVVCFSPDHNMTLPLMKIETIAKVIELWRKEFRTLGSNPHINYVQIFENKGDIMGCSNPHPHGQIWSQFTVPEEVVKKSKMQNDYWQKSKRSLLEDYVSQELTHRDRVVFENEYFVVLVPYWAVWPYETMIIPKKHSRTILELNEQESFAFAEAIKYITIKYDNIFKTSFPYSSGIHQAPTDNKSHEYWHWHMSFYPPLLRSASVKKFMVGYELFANAQRDITAEQASETIRRQSEIHYTLEQT